MLPVEKLNYVNNYCRLGTKLFYYFEILGKQSNQKAFPSRSVNYSLVGKMIEIQFPIDVQ